jgi:hypothetical protein
MRYVLMEIVNYHNNESDSFESNIKLDEDKTLIMALWDYTPVGLSVEFRLENYVLHFATQYVHIISDTIIKFLDRFLFQEDDYSHYGSFYQVDVKGRR